MKHYSRLYEHQSIANHEDHQPKGGGARSGAVRGARAATPRASCERVLERAGRHAATPGHDRRAAQKRPAKRGIVLIHHFYPNNNVIYYKMHLRPFMFAHFKKIINDI